MNQIEILISLQFGHESITVQLHLKFQITYRLGLEIESDTEKYRTALEMLL